MIGKKLIIIHPILAKKMYYTSPQ